MTSTHYRLPRHVLPKEYHVSLDASPKRARFSGSLVLTAKVVSPTSVVELHARDLKVATVIAQIPGKKKLVGKVRQQPGRETVELLFPLELSRGPVIITLTFLGKLNPSMHGLYLAKDGPERAIVSQCEATDARAIFPCFDEPDIKATLRWTVRTDAGWEVITNGVLLTRRKSRGKNQIVHAFAPTPVISTYLAAITIGHFESSPEKRVKGIPCRVWCGLGKAEQTRFAQEVTCQVLPWYQNYFGQKYNYRKLDQVAVPGFDAGAMENVGAIFYRQNLLLMQPESTSWQAQKRIAEVIAHEIAHQWFGNLVTMRWWDDLWLNEAFATWIAYKAVDIWQPQWRMWDDYLESKESALAADALVNTHPIYTEVKSPAEATELFDVITYEKGCAVLRMCENYLGAETFQAGIANYIQTFKNKNAAGADLWNALADSSGQPVGELMGSWVQQSGFPLVTVTTQELRGATTLHLSQRRYLTHAATMQEDDGGQLWVIPMVIKYDMGNGPQEHRFLMSERETTVTLPESGQPRWVYPNAMATGFFRLRLDDTLLAKLLKEGLQQLQPAERTSLLADQWALVRCGLANIDQFMEVLSAFAGERDYAVLRCVTARLSYLYEVLVPADCQDKVSAFTKHLLAAPLAEVGWKAAPDESPPKAVRRALLVEALAEIGRDEAVLAAAEQMAEQERQNPQQVEPNLAGVVVSLGALRGDKKRLQKYLQTYLQRKQEGAPPELQARYLHALSAFESPAVCLQVLQLCLDDTIPQEQLRSVVVPLLSRRATQLPTWKFLQKHWRQIGPRVGSMGVSRLVEATGALPYDLRDAVQAFFTKNPVAEAQRALQKALEAMALRQELVQRESARLRDWLQQHF